CCPGDRSDASAAPAIGGRGRLRPALLRRHAARSGCGAGARGGEKAAAARRISSELVPVVKLHTCGRAAYTFWNRQSVSWYTRKRMGRSYDIPKVPLAPDIICKLCICNGGSERR